MQPTSVQDSIRFTTFSVDKEYGKVCREGILAILGWVTIFEVNSNQGRAKQDIT